MLRSPDLWIPIVLRKSPSADWEIRNRPRFGKFPPIFETPPNSVAPGKDYRAKSYRELYLFGRFYRFYPFIRFVRFIRFIRFI